MKINQVLVESTQATVAFAFGRFNPAHQGHIEVWRAVEEAGTNWFIGTNATTIGPNDPLTFEQKSAWMEEIYPPIAGHIVAQTTVLTLAAYIFKKLRKNERATVAYITDATDWAWSGKLLNQYNGVEGAHGYYKFAEIIHEPSPRVSSATDLRNAARADDKVAFYHASGTDPKAKVSGLTYFDTVKQACEKYPLPVKRGQKVKEQGLAEHIVKVKGGYELKSKHGNKNLGKYPTKAGAEKRERQVQYFKHASESVDQNLNEFAPGNGGGESGRWYTDDQITDLVGDGWWNDLDISGDISKQEMIQEAQAWLDDQGYSVHVLNCKVNDDDMEWFIEGSFQNSNFAKKDMAEEEQKTVAKTWDQMTPQEKSSGVKGRTVWNEKTKKYYTVFDVPAKEETDEAASLATMRDYFSGDKNAYDPSASSQQRNYFSKNDGSKSVIQKKFRSQAEYEAWLKQNKLKQVSNVEEDEEQTAPSRTSNWSLINKSK